MTKYLDLVRTIREYGASTDDLTDTGTLSVFGYRMRCAEGFPLFTAKKLHLRSIIHELLWMLRGETNICCLKGNGGRVLERRGECPARPRRAG